MPIARELRHFYRTPQYRAAVEVIVKRSRDRCEWCDKPNGAAVWTRTGAGRMFWRPYHGSLMWRNEEGWPVIVEEYEIAIRFPIRKIRVVCCPAHLNHQAGDDRLENLRFLCQWCHLKQDRGHHKHTRAGHKDARRPLLALVAIA